MQDQSHLTGPPRSIVWGGALVALQGALGVIVALVLIVRGLVGHDESVANGYATAGWFLILGGAVLAAGISLLRGHRWGRGVGVLGEVLMIPVAFSLLFGSHQVALGVLVLVIVVPGLVMLLSPTSTEWLSRK